MKIFPYSSHDKHESQHKNFDSWSFPNAVLILRVPFQKDKILASIVQFSLYSKVTKKVEITYDLVK